MRSALAVIVLVVGLLAALGYLVMLAAGIAGLGLGFVESVALSALVATWRELLGLASGGLS